MAYRPTVYNLTKGGRFLITPSDIRWPIAQLFITSPREEGFLLPHPHYQEVKEAAYKGLVRPVLDYGSSVWDPPGVVLQEE